MKFKEYDNSKCADYDFDELKGLQGAIFVPGGAEELLHINPRVDEVEYIGFSTVLDYYVVLILLVNNEHFYVYEPKVNY